MSHSKLPVYDSQGYFRGFTIGMKEDRGRADISRSWVVLDDLASKGNDIAHHFVEMAKRYAGGLPSIQVLDSAIAEALQYMASDRDHLRDKLAKKMQTAAPEVITVPAKPATDGLALADELLRFVAALPLQDHPIKVQKERAAIVNRAMQKLRPYRNKLL
jgi:hypothetical protein